MNRNHLIGFAVAAVLLGALAFSAWTFLEIYPKTKYIPPSREARINDYLALDRWLADMGYQVRVEPTGDFSLISKAEEKMIFIQSSLFEWSDEAADYLLRWIEDGGNLFLVLDNFTEEYFWIDEEREPFGLLQNFGIKVTGETSVSPYDVESPDYDSDVSFGAVRDAEVLILKDNAAYIKLVQVKRGKGRITVTGRPFFLQSRHIDSAPNARLAWAFFARPSGNETFRNDVTHNGNGSFLFIRGTARIRGLFGSLFRQGNLLVLVVSVLVLLVVGFWSVIPRFGLVRADDERPGKTLRERFLAEGRFLKRYGTLGFYRDVYIKEIKRRFSLKEGLFADKEIYKRAIEYWEKTEGQKDSRALQKIFSGGSFTDREFVKIIFILKTILERI